jgi:hypothetical protein
VLARSWLTRLNRAEKKAGPEDVGDARVGYRTSGFCLGLSLSAFVHRSGDRPHSSVWILAGLLANEPKQLGARVLQTQAVEGAVLRHWLLASGGLLMLDVVLTPSRRWRISDANISIAPLKGGMLNLSRGQSPGGTQLRQTLLEKSGRHFANDR